MALCCAGLSNHPAEPSLRELWVLQELSYITDPNPLVYRCVCTFVFACMGVCVHVSVLEEKAVSHFLDAPHQVSLYVPVYNCTYLVVLFLTMLSLSDLFLKASMSYYSNILGLL